MVHAFSSTGPIGGGFPNVCVWDPNVPGKLYYGSDIGGTGRSTDYGKTFELAARGLGYQESHAKIACVNAVNISGATTIVAGTGFKGTGGEVMSSTDGANNWSVDSADISFSAQNSNAPLPTTRPRSTDPGLIQHLGGSTWIAATYDAGVWRSTDNRATWTDLNLFAGTVHARTMIRDPADPNAVYVGLWGDSGSIPNKGLWHITGLDGVPSASQVAGVPNVVESAVALGTNRLYLACGTFGVRRYEPGAGGADGYLTFDGLDDVTGPAFAGFETEMDVRVRVRPDSWTATEDLIGDWHTTDTNLQRWRFRLDGPNFEFRFRHSGGTAIFDSVAHGLTGSSELWVRVVKTAASGGLIQFFTSTDGVGWSQVGANQSHGGQAFLNAANATVIGATVNGAGRYNGRVYQALLLNPATVADPNFTNLTSGQTSHTDGQSNVWTFNGVVVTESAGGGGTVTDITGAIGTGITSSAVHGVAGASIATDRVLVGTAEGNGDVWVSNNGGSSWSNTTASGVSDLTWGRNQQPPVFKAHPNWELGQAQCDISSVAISPDNTDAWVVTATSAIWTTDNAGATWKPADHYYITSFRDAATAHTDGAVAAGNVDHDVLISSDNGATWDSLGLGGVTVTHAVDWSPDGVELAFSNNERDNNTTAAKLGVAATPRTPATPGITELTISFAPKRVVGIAWVQFAGGTHRLVLAVDNGGIWTVDRAASTWGAATQRTTAFMGSQSNGGLRCSVVSDGRLGTSGGGNIWVYDRQSGVWRSTDYGVTWDPITSVTAGEDQGYLAYDIAGDRLYIVEPTAVRRIDNATTSSVTTNLGFPTATPGACAFDDSGRLWVHAFPVGSGDSDSRLYRTSNPQAASPTWVDIADDDYRRISPTVTDMAVFGDDVYAVTAGKGLVVGTLVGEAPGVISPATETDSAQPITAQVGGPSPGAAGGACYLVVENVNSLSTDEQFYIDRLQDNLGYSVTLRGESASPPNSDDLVVIAQSTSADYKNYAGPLLIISRTDAKDFCMASNDGTLFSSTTLDITTPSHPLAGGLTGTATVAVPITWWAATTVANLPASAILIAKRPTADWYPVFGFNRGAVGTNNFVFPERRAAFMPLDQSVANLNDNGWTLFDAAISWLDGGTELAGTSSSASAHRATLAAPLEGASSSGSAWKATLIGGVAPTVPVAPPAQVATLADRVALIEADRVDVTLTVEVLDDRNRVVGTVDADNVIVRHDTNTNVHRSIELITGEELDWPVQRVRPKVTVASRRWIDTVALGVFVLTDPVPEPTNPVTWSVAGFDLLYLLDQRLVAPISYPQGQPVLAAVRQTLIGQGIFTDRIDNSRAADTLGEPRVWSIEFDGTYLTVINDLLAMIGYEQLSMTATGEAISYPKVPADQRPIAWRYDAQSPTTIVDDDNRGYETRNTNAPNFWLFWRSDVERDDPPEVGDGLYLRQNDAQGPSSIEARGGLIIRSSNDGPIEATSQSDLQVNADAIIASEIQAAAVYRFTTDANPYHEHLDILECVDRTFGVAGRFRHSAWELDVSARIMNHETTSVVGGLV